MTYKPIITVCIATLPSRDSSRLLDRLGSMKGNFKIILDDRVDISIGKKRNEMLHKVDTKWVCFIDDDDDITDEYFTEVEKADIGDYDAVRHSTEFYINGDYKTTHTNLMHYCPVRTCLSKMFGYQDVKYGEDIVHMIHMCSLPINIYEGNSSYKYYFKSVPGKYKNDPLPLLPSMEEEAGYRFTGTHNPIIFKYDV